MAINRASGTCASAPASASVTTSASETCTSLHASASAPANEAETCASAPASGSVATSASASNASAHASRRTSTSTSAPSENATHQEQKTELDIMWESYYGSFFGWFSNDKSPRVSFELPNEPYSSTGTETISSPSKSDRRSSSASTNSASFGEKVPFQLIVSVWLSFIQSGKTNLSTTILYSPTTIRHN